MNNFIENTGMKVIPAVISLCSLIWFIIPFAKGIINIGSVTGVAVSSALLMIFVFFRRFSAFIGHLWNSPAGKILVLSVSSVCVICIMISAAMSFFMIKAMNDAPPDENTTLVVLGCQVKKGRPSNMLKRRLEAAYDYLSKHDSVNVVVSGGQGADEIISEAQCMKEYLVEKGIDPGRIYIEDRSVNTEENIRFSMNLIEKQGLCSDITIVTDGFHQLRAELIAKKLGINVSHISASTRWYLLPSYWVREWYGNIYYLFTN